MIRNQAHAIIAMAHLGVGLWLRSDQHDMSRPLPPSLQNNQAIYSYILLPPSFILVHLYTKLFHQMTNLTHPSNRFINHATLLVRLSDSRSSSIRIPQRNNDIFQVGIVCQIIPNISPPHGQMMIEPIPLIFSLLRTFNRQLLQSWRDRIMQSHC